MTRIRLASGSLAEPTRPLRYVKIIDELRPRLSKVVLQASLMELQPSLPPVERATTRRKPRLLFVLTEDWFSRRTSLNGVRRRSEPATTRLFSRRSHSNVVPQRVMMKIVP